MSRINTNVSSLIAQRVLRKNNNDLNLSLERLSTGLKINRGADNPAGLIASENLRAEKVGLAKAISNAERASNVIGTAEGGLSEVSSLLNELQGLVNEAANSGGLSAEEIAANQLQVDSILNTINRVAQSTSFQGTKLLNGNLAYTTSGVGSNFANVRVNAARLPDGASMNVVATVTQSAQVASVATFASALGAASATTIEIAGLKGTEQISLAGGSALSAVTAAIDSVTNATGVDAVLSGGTIYLKSTDFGSKAFATVTTIAGRNVTGTDAGRDAAVTVNGAAASVDGKSVSFRAGTLDVEFDIADAINVTNGTASFSITGGGATFALGAKVTEADKASIGISSVSTGSLGDTTLGALSTLASGQANALTGDNLVTAQKVIDKAVKQVSQLRGRLGAFQKLTIGSTINALGVALENANAAESAIRDTDFAEETAKLTRSQILTQAATTVLAQANASPQQALLLLQ
jgi:flagellin